MTIDEFREKIINIKPNNFMSLNGAAAGIIGGANSGSEAVQQLHRSIIDFTKSYKASDNESELRGARRDITGKIMIAATVDAISEQEAEALLDALVQLMKGRK